MRNSGDDDDDIDDDFDGGDGDDGGGNDDDEEEDDDDGGDDGGGDGVCVCVSTCMGVCVQHLYERACAYMCVRACACARKCVCVLWLHACVCLWRAPAYMLSTWLGGRVGPSGELSSDLHALPMNFTYPSLHPLLVLGSSLNSQKRCFAESQIEKNWIQNAI